MVSKKNVLDAIEIARSISKGGLDFARINQGPDAAKHRKKYNEQIRPRIGEYEAKHGNTPNILLNSFLKAYVVTFNLEEVFESKGFHFCGLRVYPYVWACITKKDSDLTDGKASYYPQLYVLVDRFGIRFGYCYGKHVKKDEKLVQIVQESEDLQKNILQLLRDNDDLELYPEVLPGTGVSTEARIPVERVQDVKAAWSSAVHLIKFVPESNITDDIQDEIKATFSKLQELFVRTSIPEDFSLIEVTTPGKKKKAEEVPIHSTEENLSELSFDVRKLDEILTILRRRRT